MYLSLHHNVYKAYNIYLRRRHSTATMRAASHDHGATPYLGLAHKLDSGGRPTPRRPLRTFVTQTLHEEGIHRAFETVSLINLAFIRL